MSFQEIVDLIVCLASLAAILEYFGIKPKRNAEGSAMASGRKWKLAIMLVLVGASLGLSGYSFYRSRRPRVVEKTVTIEKPVEKIVEKLVPQNCPTQALSHKQNLSNEEAKKVIQAFVDKYHNEHPDLGWPSKEWLNAEFRKAGYRISMLTELGPDLSSALRPSCGSGSTDINQSAGNPTFNGLDIKLGPCDVTGINISGGGGSYSNVTITGNGRR
jgi:hypothetical protein